MFYSAGNFKVNCLMKGQGRRLLNFSTMTDSTKCVLYPSTHADETDLMKHLSLLLVKHSKNYFIPFFKTLFKIH